MFNGEVVVAGHICLDVIPTFAPDAGQPIRPGTLINVGPAQFSPGGTVANVGLALHRLGSIPRLIAKIGDDQFGTTLLGLLAEHDHQLSLGMRVTVGETTSYSVVINPPGIDRTFLHCPGANDRFSATDMIAFNWEGVRHLHFGYPPLMARIAANNGSELRLLLADARQHGVTTSLDMAWPDPASAAGQLDWAKILQHCLPEVDIFMPSVEELVFMLDKPHISEPWSYQQIDTLAEQCLDFGTAIVAVKLGDQGLFVRSTSDSQRLAVAGAALAGNIYEWRGRQLLAPCFAATVSGTTGAGDATIAGFILALLVGLDPVNTMTSAVAVGACSVESADATSGIPAWEKVQARIATGWPRLPVPTPPVHWQWDSESCVWIGPADQKGTTL